MEPDIEDGTEATQLHELHGTSRNAMCKRWDTPQFIPVLVRVRELNQKHLPSIDELLQVTESRVFTGARPGFLPRQFEVGCVVLLIDGMDDNVAFWVDRATHQMPPGDTWIFVTRPVRQALVTMPWAKRLQPVDFG